RDGLQEGHHPGPDQGVRCANPGPGHPQRDQGGLLTHRLRALRPRRVPRVRAQVEDGQGDRRQEDGGPSLPQVQRDGSVQLPAPAAFGVRHLQELRGLVSRGLHGWQRCGDARQGGELRAQG
ncbi:unnamed protein product, partial [Effrenium voratum]